MQDPNAIRSMVPKTFEFIEEDVEEEEELSEEEDVAKIEMREITNTVKSPVKMTQTSL